MENPTHSFREANFVLQLIKESQIKSKTVSYELELAKEKGGHFLYCFFSEFFPVFFFSILKRLSEYTYFYITKNITSYTFLLVFKIVESLQCVLNTFFILIFFAPLAKSVSTVCYIYGPIHSKC